MATNFKASVLNLNANIVDAAEKTKMDLQLQVEQEYSPHHHTTQSPHLQDTKDIMLDKQYCFCNSNFQLINAKSLIKPQGNQ